MTRVRAPAVAGTFYPVSPRGLQRSVDGLLAAASPPPLEVEPRMAVVPHAGYIYSGPVAATAFAALRDRVATRVLLLGPAHFVRFAGLATSGCAAFATPLGRLEIAEDLRNLAAAHAYDNPVAHEREHSLEVQLPFLQSLWPHVQMLPVLTGDDDPAAGAALLADIAATQDALLLISSDLSHYLDQAAAQRRDAATAAAIVALQAGGLGPGSACGRTAIRAALEVAASRGWRCQQLDLRTSGDTHGGRDRVVGYGAFILGPVRA